MKYRNYSPWKKNSWKQHTFSIITKCVDYTEFLWNIARVNICALEVSMQNIQEIFFLWVDHHIEKLKICKHKNSKSMNTPHDPLHCVKTPTLKEKSTPKQHRPGKYKYIRKL